MDMIIPITDLLQCCGDSIDMVSPTVHHHHRRVVRIAHDLGWKYKLGGDQMHRLLIAASIHDLGAFTVKRRLDILGFDNADNSHAQSGADLAMHFRPFHQIAPIIRHHHTTWQQASTHAAGLEDVPLESQILFLADRIAVLINDDLKLNQTGEIIKKIDSRSGISFNPELVELFHQLSRSERFWLDARDAVVEPMLFDILADNLHLDLTDLSGLGKIFSRIIDFRSPFTATHSAGVSAVAQALAELCGFCLEECQLMKLAGDLHDIGKLVVPEAILEKPSGLTSDELGIIRSHTYFTDRLLVGIKAFDVIRVWAALHHERLDGTGYPFRLSGDQIPLGSRIMAVADIYTAISEERPYRRGMEAEAARSVLNSMARNGAIDERIVRLMNENQKYIEAKRSEAQAAAREEYWHLER